MIASHRVHRFSMKKAVIAPVALLTASLACVAVGIPAAQATDGTNAVFGKWASTGFTTAQTDPGPPADPDGQTGEDNLANVKQIGERHERADPATKHESSGWLRHAPEEDGWVQLPGADGEKSVQDTEAHDQIVVDKKAWTETVERRGRPLAALLLDRRSRRGRSHPVLLARPTGSQTSRVTPTTSVTPVRTSAATAAPATATGSTWTGWVR